jgi:hypothetical protein
MAQKIKTSLPGFLDLGGNWHVEWDAVDPTTGASVSGVLISATSLHVAGDFGDAGKGTPTLIPAPLLAHEPADG